VKPGANGSNTGGGRAWDTIRLLPGLPAAVAYAEIVTYRQQGGARAPAGPW
jgi:hypothetical protein